MPVERSSQQASSEPAPSRERSELMGFPQAISQSAVQYVLSQCGDGLGHITPTDVCEIADRIVAGVLAMQVTPTAVIDTRTHSPIGRGLLDAMREEVLTRWREHGVGERELPRLLLAMERTREAIHNPAAHALVTQLGGSAGLELLAEVAHDMHSPLASILVLADTLQREGSGPLNDVQRSQVGLIATAALGLSSVGSDIIDLTRSHLLLEPQPIPFSVASVLESVRDIVRPVAEVKQLAIRLHLPTMDERQGHPVALRRVLLNLTTNALKFTESGFVEISTRECRPGKMEFSVRDTGRGIDPAMMPTLFDSVRDVPRGDHRRGKLFSTTGLGLAICRKLTEGMGSRLQVETLPGRGTRFFFELDLPECSSRREPSRTNDTGRIEATPAA